MSWGDRPTASRQRSILAWGWILTRGATPSTALVPQQKVGFPIPNPRLLLGFQGTKSARREGISSPFSDAGGCTSRGNSGGILEMDVFKDYDPPAIGARASSRWARRCINRFMG
jgi:hypothetical protein